jgi:hypothetical protein
MNRMDRPVSRMTALSARRPVRREYREAAQGRPELAFVTDPDNDRGAVRCSRRHQAQSDDLSVLLGPDRDSTVASRPCSGLTSAAGIITAYDAAFGLPIALSPK